MTAFRDLLTVLSLLLVASLLAYLGIVAVFLDFNLMGWTETQRAIWLCLTIVLALIGKGL